MTYHFPTLETALQVRPVTLCATSSLEMLPTEQNQQEVLQFGLRTLTWLSLKAPHIDNVNVILNRITDLTYHSKHKYITIFILTPEAST